MGTTDAARRDQMLIYCSIAYALGAICNFLRLINSCSYWESVGVLKIILFRMIKNDISSWFVITIWYTFGFSVAFAVLEPANANNENQLDRPFFIPWQGLLGEFDFGARYDVLEAGTTIAVIVPILLWVYTFVATVILVNLLIAQMSSTYEERKEDSCNIWRADRVHSVVSEYKDNREVLPPPLNILTLPYHVRNGTLRAWARCCTDSAGAAQHRRLRHPRLGGEDGVAPQAGEAQPTRLCQAARVRTCRRPSDASRTSSDARRWRPRIATCSSSSTAASTT